MNLAEQMQADINYQKIINNLRSGLTSSNKILIESNLFEGNGKRLEEDGFKINYDGQQYNGGVYVGFKTKHQQS
jgi:hypothetical protein